MFRNLLLTFVAGAILGAVVQWNLRPPCQPWVPVLEETNFRYLDGQVGELGGMLGEVETALAADQGESAGELLASASAVVRSLQSYYLPLTEVRQLIYDADRLYFLGKTNECLLKLHAASKIVHGMGEHPAGASGKIGQELALAVEDSILEVESRSQKVPDKLGNLGHKVNLLVLKGELEL